MRCTDADTKKFCIHSDGLGYCDILSDGETLQYCVESPCPHEKLVEYEPVRHGRWIEKEGLFGETFYRCSACEEDIVLLEGEPMDNWYNYCPNCGADMRGTKDE